MPDAESTLRGAHVELRDISKSFGGTRALEGVSLTIGRGQIHALVGENGAGKSTLGKIIAGAHTADSGQVTLDGEPARFHSPREAIARGVILIAQELAIVPALTVEQNVFLGVEPRQAGFQHRRELRRRYQELAASVGFELDGAAVAGTLRTADQQKVEILRALSRNAQLIVMDEPTAALSRPDVEALHGVIRQLASQGTTVVLVSHFLNEVLELADQVTILRDGRLVQTVPATGQSEESLMAAMLGRSFDATFPAKRPPAPDARTVLSVRELNAPGVNGVSFDLRAGEVLGLAGLVGAGRSEVARAIYRANRVHSGSVRVARGDGTRAVTGTPRTAMRAGVLMIPESRKEQGLLLGRPVRENVSLSTLAMVSRAGMVQPRRGAAAGAGRAHPRGRPRRRPVGPRVGAVRRQPAEAAFRQVAAARPGRADRGRADPRRRRRRQAGHLRAADLADRRAAWACCLSPPTSRRSSAWPTACSSCAAAGSPPNSPATT